MKIILNENKFSSLVINGLFESFNINPITQKIDGDFESLKKLLKRDGVLMTNIKNGKTYCVYEIVSIANVIGKRFGVILLMKDGELYGPLSVKPLNLFKVKNY